MVAFQGLSPYVFQLDIKINDIQQDFVCSKLNITHEANSACTLVMELLGSSTADLFHLGSTVKVAGSHGFGDLITEETPFDKYRGSTVLPLRFNGIVRLLQPKYNSVVVTCTDMVSTLATGEVRNYKAEDYVGDDLYYVAKSIFDDFNEVSTTYGSALGSYDFWGGRWFDTSLLTEGSEIMATEDMNIWGVQTPKQFLDKVFDEMYKGIFPSDYSVNQYEKNEYYNWKYYITHHNKVFFYYNDVNTITPKVTHKLKEDSAGIMVKGIQARVDTSRMVNSLTITNTSDKTISGLHEDQNSIAKFGKMSKTFSSNSTDGGELQDQAYKYVERYKFPTYTYTVKTGMNFMFLPSDLVEITAPSVGIDEVLPVESSTFTLNNGSIESTITLGERQLPISELIQRNIS